jgi:hypothetical protein
MQMRPFDLRQLGGRGPHGAAMWRRPWVNWMIDTHGLSCFILSCECLIGFLLNVNKGPANDKPHRPLHPPSAGAAASSCAQHFHLMSFPTLALNMLMIGEL